MTYDSTNCRSHCPINFILETFGDRWTLLIIRDLMFKRKNHYGEFLLSDEKISTNILADRLKRLEEHEIIFKANDPDNRSKVIYNLTEKGKALMPIMIEMTAWSAKFDAKTNTPDDFLNQLAQNKQGLLRQLRARLD